MATQDKYMVMDRLICVGTLFLNLWEKAGEAGDHVPKEDRGDTEDAGECIVKVRLNEASSVGEPYGLKDCFSSSMATSLFSARLVSRSMPHHYTAKMQEQRLEVKARKSWRTEERKWDKPH